jgi:hypothetical protein
MASINSGRVVTAGLLAGVVLNVFDIIWNFTVMQADLTAIATKLGMDPAAAMSFSGAIPWIIVDFVIGLALVWTYAAIRPRFGPGPSTAVIAAIPLWLATSAVVYGFTSMGLMSTSAWVKGTVTALITMAIGSVAGAWAYKEA